MDYCRLEVRKNFFSKRVIEKWNSLTAKEVSAMKTSEFKERYGNEEKKRKKSLEENIYVWT